MLWFYEFSFKFKFKVIDLILWLYFMLHGFS
jgi:hypothetical protein